MQYCSIKLSIYKKTIILKVIEEAGRTGWVGAVLIKTYKNDFRNYA